MKNGFKMSAVIPAPPAEVYKAWLSTQGHTAMTGSPARVSRKQFTAWDGYISGRTLALEPDRRIVQAWRTAEFAEEDPDSHLDILLTPVKGGTKITLNHMNLPPGQAASYKQGWEDFYFKPMKMYFKR